MARYHLSPTVGPAKCSARFKCEFSDSEGNEPQHYPNKAAAYKAYEEQLSSENSITSTISADDSHRQAGNLKENDLVDLENLFREHGGSEEQKRLSTTEYSRIDFIEKTRGGNTLIHTTTHGSITAPANFSIPVIYEEDDAEIEEVEEIEQYSDFEKQEMFDDAVMDFDGARERYAVYLSQLPEETREKEIKKYRDAIRREESWNF